MVQIGLGIAILLLGGLLGYRIRVLVLLARKNSVEIAIKERLVHAREEAQKIIDEAQEKAETIRHETRLNEEHLLKRETILDERQKKIDGEYEELQQKNNELSIAFSKAALLLEEREHALSELAGYSKEEALRTLISETEKIYQEDLLIRNQKLEKIVKENLKERAQDILVSAIQRLASPTTTELTTSSVAVPNDESKGKIIGKEGRNIRAFERVAGVELLIDDAPGYIIISSFDPVRRAVAKDALEELIKDGRIQPAKIEEEVQKSKEKIHEIIKEKGSAAVYECGIYNFDPKLITILGQLHFRTSYGQNVLQHSIEMAHLAEMIASEVGADPYIAKAGALVHDIGKAVDHAFEGSHVALGIKILRRFGTDERVINAMKSHHDDCPHESVEAVIVQTVDIISSARPGARRDNAEAYIKRLAALEQIASSFTGVEKAYALQAGREVRIFVHPQSVSDYEAQKLARAIAVSIETELKYPGEIKVTIIRETRIIDFAR